MSRPADCWDNAIAESFFATLKKELVHGCAFATRTEAYDTVHDYIENFYNAERRHSGNAFLSPNAWLKTRLPTQLDHIKTLSARSGQFHDQLSTSA